MVVTDNWNKWRKTNESRWNMNTKASTTLWMSPEKVLAKKTVGIFFTFLPNDNINFVLVH